MTDTPEGALATDQHRARSLRWLYSARSKVVAWPGGRTIWRVGIALLGLLVVGIGIVLLPLPGPGWAIIFGGVGVWATEFDWARRLLAWARDQVSRWTAWYLARPLFARVIVGVLAVAALAGIAYLCWSWLY